MCREQGMTKVLSKRHEGVVWWGQHLKVAAAHPMSSLVETLACL